MNIRINERISLFEPKNGTKCEHCGKIIYGHAFKFKFLKAVMGISMVSDSFLSMHIHCTMKGMELNKEKGYGIRFPNMTISKKIANKIMKIYNKNKEMFELEHGAEKI